MTGIVVSIAVVAVIAGAGGAARGEGALVPCKKCPGPESCSGGCRNDTCTEMTWWPACPKLSPPSPPPPTAKPPRSQPAVVKKPKPKPTELVRVSPPPQVPPEPVVVQPAASRPVDAVMVRVPAGCFQMGSGDDDDDNAAHEVCLSAFDIDRDEVTNEAYRQCVSAHACERPEDFGPGFARPRQPITGVSWHDAVAYCQFAGKELPTEAQWEYAARGSDGRKYPWGNTITCMNANYGSSMWTDECKGRNPGRTVDVGSYPDKVSPFRARDMAGNLREWVRDSYDREFYQKSPRQDPFNPGKDSDVKILRGGSWFDDARGVHAADRNFGAPAIRVSTVGFRCSRVVR